MTPPHSMERAIARAGGRPGPDFSLLLAGLLTAFMALYHFWLPYAFRWGDALTHVPMVRWGLFILNASFSYLLLAGGVMTVVIAFKPELKARVGRMVLAGMAGYWVLNAGWQVLLPMPMPGALAALRWAFLGFSVSVALLYLGGLKDRRPVVITAPADRPVPRGPRVLR